jgi:hypothetical protein
MTERRSLLLLLAALLLVGVLIGLGLRYHWTLALPVAASLRVGAWLARGVYCSVPLLVMGGLLLKLLRRPVSGLPGLIALPLCWAGGSLVVIALGLITLATGTYSPMLWQVLAPVGWIAAVVWSAVDRWSALTNVWHKLRSGGGSGPPLVSWASVLVVLGVLAALHGSLPPDTRDELAYHLVAPQQWALQGDWWLPADNFHLLFPGNTELVWGWAASVGGPLAPRFVTLVFALLTVALLWQWFESEGINRWLRDISLALFVVTPAVLTAAAVCYVEWPLMFLLLLGWRLSRSGDLIGGRPATVSCAAVWAAAVGMKYTAILFVGLLGLGWLVRLWRDRPVRAVSAGLVLAVAIGVLAAPWWVRNWAATGDPVYPLGSSVGLARGDPEAAETLTEYVELQGPWRWMPWLYHATADPISDHRLHPLWPFIHLSVLVVGWRWRRDLPWFAVLGATAALVTFHPAPRVLLPLLLLDTLFLPRMLTPLVEARTTRTLVNVLTVLMVVVSAPIAFHYLMIAGGPVVPGYLLGLSSQGKYLHERGLVTPAVRWIHERTPEESRLWTWCEDQTLYFDRRARPDSPYGPPAFLTAVTEGGATALADQTGNVDLVVVRRDRCPDSWQSARFEKRSWAIDADQREAIQSWAADHLAELVRDDRYTVYQVR